MRSTYRDLGHAGILAAVGLGGAVDRAIALSGSVLVGEVINHLRVELLGGLGLATTSVAALARGLGSTATATGAAGGLGSSRRLGLGLLCDALAERLGGGNLRGEGGVVNNLDLWWAIRSSTNGEGNSGLTDLHGVAIDEAAVDLGGLRGRVGLAEDDLGDTTALAVLVVGDDHLLDSTCKLAEVFL